MAEIVRHRLSELREFAITRTERTVGGLNSFELEFVNF